TPSSLGLSFIHDAPELSVTARAARYERIPVEDGAPSAGADGTWQRVPLGDQSVIIPAGSNGQHELWGGLGRLQWRSRPGRTNPIVTVSLSNASHVPL